MDSEAKKKLILDFIIFIRHNKGDLYTKEYSPMAGHFDPPDFVEVSYGEFKKYIDVFIEDTP